MRTLYYLLACALLSAASPYAAEVVYELNITETTLSPAGSPQPVLAINGGIPGPVLRFREGDTARITVRNHLRRESTSIHWHGLLVPNEMDGVPYVTTPPIPPGGSHEFVFELRHAGTYWYHSHTGLQEQRGMYGGIVIEPRGGETHRADHDHVVVLSDWTNEDPKEVMRTLMRGSHYYQFRKNNLQSIAGAIRAGAFKDYLQREKSRMPAMDISDVYYDAFLINGSTEQTLPARPGETVRLRLINAAASTYFYVQSAAGPMSIVAADGPPVRPAEVDRLLIGMAETYDVLVTVPESGAWEVRATAQDNSNHASLFIGEGDRTLADDLPAPDLYRMDEMLEAGIASVDDEMARMANPERPVPPYHLLEAPEPTTLPADAPVREIELRLTGDMERYIWSFNGKTYAEEPTVAVREGEVLRVTMINDTMMHHPIHLHGHFFRLINSHGERSPLKHTVDVPPMGQRTIEFLANERGDWLVHCHLLYHMDAGMTRVFSYEKAEDPEYEPGVDPAHLGMTMFTLDGMLLHSMTMGHAHFMRGRETLGLDWHYAFHGHGGHGEKNHYALPAPGHGGHGGHGHKRGGGHGEDNPTLEGEYEVDLYWSRYFNPNFSTAIGYRLSNEEGTGNRAFAQINYRFAYMIVTSLAIDSRGDLRAGVEREFQITPRISADLELEYDTGGGFEWAAYAHYLLTKELSLTGGYHNEHG